MAEVVCVGDLLIDFVPTVTGTGLIDAPAFQKAPGGAAANVAVGLARLGVASAFMGMVGEDPFGRFLADTLAGAGVDTGPLRFTPAARTALAFVSLRADGEREFMFYRHPSADMLFTPVAVDTAAVAAAQALHFDSISLAGEIPHGQPVRRGSGAGRRPAGHLRRQPPPAALARRRGRKGIRAGLAKARGRQAERRRARVLTGRRDPDAVREALWHDGLRLVTLTRGSAAPRG